MFKLLVTVEGNVVVECVVVENDENNDVIVEVADNADNNDEETRMVDRCVVITLSKTYVSVEDGSFLLSCMVWIQMI